MGVRGGQDEDADEEASSTSYSWGGSAGMGGPGVWGGQEGSGGQDGVAVGPHPSPAAGAGLEVWGDQGYGVGASGGWDEVAVGPHPPSAVGVGPEVQGL